MRHPTPSVLTFLLVAGVWLPGLRADEASTATFRFEELAPGVHLARPVVEDYARTNSLVVEQKDGLLVVESQPSPQAARELIAAIGGLSPDPIRYLVLSHPHAESVGGASAFPASTLVVATRPCYEALADESFAFGGEIRARAEDPETWVAPPRRLPTAVLEGSLYLDDPTNPVRIRPLPYGHARGSLMVVLPQLDTYYVGALLFQDRNPYARDGEVGGWLSALNAIMKTAPGRLIALYGPPTDTSALRAPRDSLAWTKSEVEMGFVDGIPASQIAARVLEDPALARHFDTDASPSFVRGLLERAVEETLTVRRNRGFAVD